VELPHGLYEVPAELTHGGLGALVVLALGPAAHELGARGVLLRGRGLRRDFDASHHPLIADLHEGRPTADGLDGVLSLLAIEERELTLHGDAETHCVTSNV
jgi:hypothetical protein